MGAANSRPAPIHGDVRPKSYRLLPQESGRRAQDESLIAVSSGHHGIKFKASAGMMAEALAYAPALRGLFGNRLSRRTVKRTEIWEHLRSAALMRFFGRKGSSDAESKTILGGHHGRACRAGFEVPMRRVRRCGRKDLELDAS